jgi:hypothetical protein
MSLKEFMKELNGSRVEGELIKTILISLLVSSGVIVFYYYMGLNRIEGFIENHSYFILFSSLSYALVIPSIRQVRAYKYFACMSGMMVGMTTGMIAGFLIGFFVGGTNGMFWGSVSGMSIGILFGGYNGNCCGIMGIMEGIMAGFMGGLMGAMTAVMMINDNLKIAGVIIFIISAVIIFGLNYMIYGEMKTRDREIKEGQWFNVFITFLLITLTTWMIVFGPRSNLFGGGF